MSEVKVKQEPVDEADQQKEEECCVCFKPMSALVPAAMWCEQAQFKHLFCGECANDFANSKCPICRCPLVRYRDIAPNVVDLVSPPTNAVPVNVWTEIREHIHAFRPELVKLLWPAFLRAQPFHVCPGEAFDVIKMAARKGMSEFAVQALVGLKATHRDKFQRLVQQSHCFRLLSIHYADFTQRCMTLLPDEVMAEISDCDLPTDSCMHCRGKLYQFIGTRFLPPSPVIDKVTAHMLCHSESFAELKQHALLLKVDVTPHLTHQYMHLMPKMHASVVEGLLDTPQVREEAFQWLVTNKGRGKIRSATLTVILRHAPKEWMWPADWKEIKASKPYLPHYTLDPDTLQMYRAPERTWQENPQLEKCKPPVLLPLVLTLLPIAPPVKHEVEVDHVVAFRFDRAGETVCFSFPELFSMDYVLWKKKAQNCGIRLDNNVTYRAKSFRVIVFEQRNHKPF